MSKSESIHECPTLSTKVDSEQRGWIEDRADWADKSLAEYLRRVITVYRKSATGNLRCECGEEVNMAELVER